MKTKLHPIVALAWLGSQGVWANGSVDSFNSFNSSLAPLSRLIRAWPLYRSTVEAMQDLIADAQSELGINNGDVDMFLMDLPISVHSGMAPMASIVLVAQTNQTGIGDSSAREVGVCHLVQSVGSGVTAGENGENTLSPIQSAKNYFRSRESLRVRGEAVVRVLETPTHGSLKGQDDGEYSYLPNEGYVGKDRAVFLVEVGGYKVKLIYYFQALDHAIGNTGYKDLCGKNGTYWKISNTTSLSDGFGVNNLEAWQRGGQLATLLATASQSLTGFQDLPDSSVGQTTGQGPTAQITLDSNAAGHG